LLRIVLIQLLAAKPNKSIIIYLSERKCVVDRYRLAMQQPVT